MGKCMHTIHVRGIDVLLLRLKVISSYVRPPESRNENDRLHYHRKQGLGGGIFPQRQQQEAGPRSNTSRFLLKS